MPKSRTRRRQAVRFDLTFSWTRIIVCAVLLAVLAGAYFFLPTILGWPATSDTHAAALTWHTVDVGQGDCTVVQFPDNKVLMVDTGKSSAYDKIINYLDDRQITTIDWLVITHPDDDHYGSAAKLLDNPNLTFKEKYCESCQYDVMTDSSKSDSARAAYQKMLDYGFTEPDDDLVIDGNDYNYKITFVSPHATDAITKPNDASIMLTIEYYNKIFVLTGDAGTEVEPLFINRAAEIFADNVNRQVILKVGHHGSRYSSGDAFLSFIFGADNHNNFAIISCGQDNRYGHPHDEALTRLQNYCATENILVTKDVGNIVVQATAETLTVNGQDYDVSYTTIFISIGVVIVLICFVSFGARERRK